MRSTSITKLGAGAAADRSCAEAKGKGLSAKRLAPCALRFALCPWPLRWLLPLAGGALAALVAAPGRGQQGLGADDYRLLPLRMHLLRAKAAPDLDCRLQDADARRILGKINGIWRQAGIQFYADAVLSEEAANQELYQGLGENRTDGHLRIIRPRGSMSDRTFHVYYVRQMRPNGICFQNSFELLFVKDTASLRKVPGGIDEDPPRVSAHEIGHALDLPHRQDTTNLMASGTTGTSLNEAEVKTTREAAERLPWHLKPADALAQADRLAAEQHRDQAAALYTALAALPDGTIAAAARKRSVGGG